MLLEKYLNWMLDFLDYYIEMGHIQLSKSSALAIDDSEKEMNGHHATSSLLLLGPERQHDKRPSPCTTTRSDTLKDSTGHSERVYRFARCLLLDERTSERHMENGIQNTFWNV